MIPGLPRGVLDALPGDGFRRRLAEGAIHAVEKIVSRRRTVNQSIQLLRPELRKICGDHWLRRAEVLVDLDRVGRHGEIVDLCVKQGLDEKAGSWYSYDENRSGQGKGNVRSILKENPDIVDEIEAKIREKLMPSAADKSLTDGAKKAKQAEVAEEEVKEEVSA